MGTDNTAAGHQPIPVGVPAPHHVGGTLDTREPSLSTAARYPWVAPQWARDVEAPPESWHWETLPQTPSAGTP